jgi:4-hydroxyphenylpyruvate dioxygenase
VDHVAQTMQHEEMLSWLLYYLSLFDVSKTPVVQVADPLGLVQSQAIESAEGGLRIALNASTSSQTLSARFCRVITAPVCNTSRSRPPTFSL